MISRCPAIEENLRVTDLRHEAFQCYSATKLNKSASNICSFNKSSFNEKIHALSRNDF